jgi:prolyl-tRNA synthetase
LSEQKLTDATGVTALRPAHADEIRTSLGASPGSLGAVGVRDLPVLADEALRGRRNMFTGANTDDFHLRGVDMDRHIAVRTWADLREVTAGQPCPRCGQPVQVQRAIEVGHIFKLGYRYADALDATVLDPGGARTKVIMGSYGIGVERAMAAIVECCHDDKGIVWPMAVAPFQVAVVVAQSDDEAVAQAGEQVYQQLLADRVEAIIDDRDERAGVKFSDVELVGIPLRITVGKRALGQGMVELSDRASGQTDRVPIDQLGCVRKAIETAS